MRQQGFSFFGLIFLIAILGALVSVVIKVLPPWMDFLTISEAAQSVISQPRMGLQRDDQILSKIETQVSINNISLRSYGRDPVTLSREGQTLSAIVDYEVTQPLFEFQDVVVNINMQFYKVHEVSLAD